MRLDPVQKASPKVMKENSWDIQRIRSSDSREMCMQKMERSARSSQAKSRSATASMLLRVMAGNFSFFRTYSRSMGSVVPARAPDPRGMMSIRFLVSARRPRSGRPTERTSPYPAPRYP